MTKPKAKTGPNILTPAELIAPGCGNPDLLTRSPAHRPASPADLAPPAERPHAQDDLWTRDQPDGDPFVVRAAELLEEQETQLDLLTRMVDQLGSQLAAMKAAG